MVLWLATAPFLFTASPLTVLTVLSTLLAEGEFYRDVSVSLSELAAGMLISGLLAAGIVSLRNRYSIVSCSSDLLIQACQLAPIAALPKLQYVYGVQFSRWSILCVAIFTLYPFMCAFTGLRGQAIIRRVALATSEALPYGCAAIVFGEMWNATAGIGFMMTVAAATHQIDKGIAGFLVFIMLFAMLTIVLHWTARNVSFNPAWLKSVLGF
jgi:ABC-type nitrate/sulfonate/bicarbonate transport system permease component